jgi:hypothetical protein
VPLTKIIIALQCVQYFHKNVLLFIWYLVYRFKIIFVFAGILKNDHLREKGIGDRRGVVMRNLEDAEKIEGQFELFNTSRTLFSMDVY